MSLSHDALAYAGERRLSFPPPQSLRSPIQERQLPANDEVGWLADLPWQRNGAGIYDSDLNPNVGAYITSPFPVGQLPQELAQLLPMLSALPADTQATLSLVMVDRPAGSTQPPSQYLNINLNNPATETPFDAGITLDFIRGDSITFSNKGEPELPASENVVLLESDGMPIDTGELGYLEPWLEEVGLGLSPDSEAPQAVAPLDATSGVPLEAIGGGRPGPVAQPADWHAFPGEEEPQSELAPAEVYEPATDEVQRQEAAVPQPLMARLQSLITAFHRALNQ